MKKIESILHGISDLSGVMILWKRANGSGCGLAACHTFHECDFCRAVKADPIRSALCSRNDSILLAEEAERRREPFLHRCHAGVTELIVPVLDGGRCRELFLAGVFREVDSCNTCPEAEAEFAALPLAAELPLDTLSSMLAALAPMLCEQRGLRQLNDVAQTVQDPRIASAAAAIRQRPGQAFSVTGLARSACLSESRFIHLFRAETGFSFSEYLARERVREAKRLLIETDLPLLRIALECGFHDQSHFSGRFRRATGLTPLGCRRKYGHSQNT